MSKVVGVLVVIIAAVAGWYVWGRGQANDTAIPVASPAAPKTAHVESKPIDPAEGRDWADRVLLSQEWTIPAGNRLPGVTSAALVDSLESWIQSLPADQQETARQFTARHAVAYEIRSKEQLAWMIEHGFPALEEVAAFDYQQHTANCASIRCENGKISALAADKLIGDMEAIMPEDLVGALDQPDLSASLSSEQLGELSRAIGEARTYIDRSRDNGSTLFSAYLAARLAKVTGDVERAEAAYAFAGACGDPRAARHGAASAVAVGVVLSLSAGGHRACGTRVGVPVFPSAY